jgi:hypothetical protein
MNEIQKDIVFFYFCCTRKYNHTDLFLLSLQLNNILTKIKTRLCECDDTLEIEHYISYFILLYKLIVYTRDITEGKGERDLTYMMMDIWYDHFPVLSKHILEIIPEKYGSWKVITEYYHIQSRLADEATQNLYSQSLAE